jgi:hypothetical protein
MPFIDAITGERQETDPPPDWVQGPDGSWAPPGYRFAGTQGTTGNPTQDKDGNPTGPLTINAQIGGPTPESIAQQQLNNHFQYGGGFGEANKDADYYRKIGEDAQNRPGAQIDTSRAHGLANQAQGNAAAEGRVADLMWKRATGQTPSIAGMRADEDMRTLSAAQSSAAASARGPAALALAQQEAAANTANGQSTISNLAQINSAQERSDAEKNAYGAYSGMRGQDFQGQALEQDVAAKQAAIDAAQKAENDRMQLGQQANEIEVNKAQLGAQGNQIGIATGAAQAEANRDAAGKMHDEDRTDKYIGYGAGIAGGVGGALLLGALGGGTGSSGGSGSGSGGGAGSAPDGRGFGAPGAPEGDAPGWLDNYMDASGSSGNPVDPTAGKAPMPVGGGPTPASLNRFGASTSLAPAPPPTIASLGAAPAAKPATAPTLATAPPNASGPLKPPAPPNASGPLKPPAPPNASGPLKPPAPTTLASTTYKSPNPATITSDEREKYGFSEEGNYTPAGGMSRDSRVPTNRVDAFMDGMHPLSYRYKDPAQEPRSKPTGGRYLGVSAQDLERTPTGKQLVSEGPRGKQVEVGPSLSAALAGVARLHERVKDLETQQTGDAANLAAGPSVGGPKPMTPRERDLMAQAEAMQEGNRANLAAGPSVRRVADGTRDTGYRTTLTDGAERSFNRDRQALYGNDSGNDYDLRGAYAAGESRAGNGHMTDRFKMPNHETFSDESQYAEDRPEIAGHWDGDRYSPKGPPGWLRQEMERPAFQPFRVTHEDGRTMMIERPGQDFDPGPDASLVRRLPAFERAALLRGPSKWDLERDRSNGAASGMSDEQDFENNPQPYDDDLIEARNDMHPLMRGFTSDMRAKDDVVSESAFGPEQDIDVSNGRFQPPAAPRRAATPMARADAGPQRRENAASQRAYEGAAHASTLAVPLGWGATLGSFGSTLKENRIQDERREAMRPVAPVARPVPASAPAPTLANLDNYGAPTPEELARYGASPAEIAAAMRMNGGGR